MNFYARNRKSDGEFQLLETHLFETAYLAECFGNDFGLGKLLRLSGMLHDFGKYTILWQQYLENNIAEKKHENKDHATAGGQFIEHKISQEPSLAEQIIQAIVMFHHGQGLPDFLNLKGETDFKKRLCKDDTKQDLPEIESNFSEKVKAEIQKCLESDYLKNDARNKFYDNCKIGCRSKKQYKFNQGLHLRNLSSCLIDADRTNSANFDI